jgi:hypothetical protein
VARKEHKENEELVTETVVRKTETADPFDAALDVEKR